MKNENHNGNGQTAGNNNTNNQPEPRRRLTLPLMKTIEDARQLSQIERDNFYISAFLIQCWIGDATLAVSAEYAEKKEARTRSLQTGQTLRSFLEILGSGFQVGRIAPRAPSGPDSPAAPGIIPTLEDLDKEQLTRFTMDIFRFTDFDDPIAAIVRSAMQCLLTEYDDDLVISDQPATLVRLCEWIDSMLHLQTNLM